LKPVSYSLFSSVPSLSLTALPVSYLPFSRRKIPWIPNLLRSSFIIGSQRPALPKRFVFSSPFLLLSLGTPSLIPSRSFFRSSKFLPFRGSLSLQLFPFSLVIPPPLFSHRPGGMRVPAPRATGVCSAHSSSLFACGGSRNLWISRRFPAATPGHQSLQKIAIIAIERYLKLFRPPSFLFPPRPFFPLDSMSGDWHLSETEGNCLAKPPINPLSLTFCFRLLLGL